MNSKQRRVAARQVARDWPPGTLVTFGSLPDNKYKVRDTSGWQGLQLRLVRVSDSRLSSSVHPNNLKRIPK